MDLVGKSVRNTDGNIGVIQNLRIEDDRVEVFYESYNETRTYKFSLALNHSLTFADRETQITAEKLAEEARGFSKQKGIYDGLNRKIEKRNPYNINYDPGRVEREASRDCYNYGNNKSIKTERRSHNLSLTFNALKRTIKNACYDLKQPELTRKAPANKEEYYPENYDERWDQACYVLRYSYAYAFEYCHLYAKILGKICKPGHLKVLSLGCGAMTDAWSLEAACNLRKEVRSIEYLGIDKAIRWENDYQPETATIMRKESFFDTCAGLYLMSCNSIDYDVIIFPKSLRDIYCNDFDDYLRIRKAFETKSFTNNKICIAFSLINNPGSNDNERYLQRDQEIIKELIDGLKKQGFALRGAPLENIISKDAVYYNSGYPEIDERLKDESEILTGKRMMTSRRYQRYIAYILGKER